MSNNQKVRNDIRKHLMEGITLDPIVPLREVTARQSQVLDFEQLRKNRFSLGFYRYRHDFTNNERGNYDVINDALERIKKYKQDGNLEHLVDSANLLALEFMSPSNPNAHFTSIDDGEHTEYNKNE